MKIIAKLLAATTAIGMATSAYAQDMTLKFGHVGNPGPPLRLGGNNLTIPNLTHENRRYNVF
jgi:hypothetical protein